MPDTNPAVTILGAIQQLGETLGTRIDGLTASFEKYRDTQGEHAVKLGQVTSMGEDLTKLESRVDALEKSEQKAAIESAGDRFKGNLVWTVGGIIGTLVVVGIVGALLSLVMQRPQQVMVPTPAAASGH